MNASANSVRVTSPTFKFQSPPIKMLAEPLSRCTRRVEGQPAFWMNRGLGNSELDVSVVWMQGTILEVRPEGDTTVRLRDETGNFSVSGINSVPKGKPCLTAGKYVMIMGVVQSCSPEPSLRAVKMTDLSGNPIHRSMWRLEVEDLHRTLHLM
ncbi:recQ-mediated genome instability protein 2 isoform X2 [Ambystoma mexicanum]